VSAGAAIAEIHRMHRSGMDTGGVAVVPCETLAEHDLCFQIGAAYRDLGVVGAYNLELL
jgi:hypothetical protein